MANPIRLAFASLAAILPIALMSCTLHGQQATPTPADRAASVDSIVQTEILARGVASVQVVITRGDETLLSRTRGFADIDARRRADDATTYRLGSMAKHITAALLLKRVDRGELSLNDPIGRYLAGLKPEWNDRTIAQILNHTSGLPRKFREIGRISENLPTDSLIALARRTDAPTEPAGTTFIYSNTGYMLLGALGEKLYGKSYGAALRDEIAQPLGLETIAWCGDLEATGSQAEASGSHAMGYHGQADSTVGAPRIPPGAGAAGARVAGSLLLGPVGARPRLRLSSQHVSPRDHGRSFDGAPGGRVDGPSHRSSRPSP